MNCKSENVFYCAICLICKAFYIGHTGKLNPRVRVHKEQNKGPSVSNILCCEHFAKCGQGKFTLLPICKLQNENETLRHFVNFKMKMKHYA